MGELSQPQSGLIMRVLTTYLKAALEANDSISREQATALASTNVEQLLGIHRQDDEVELIATRGGEHLGYGKVVAVISPRRGLVDIF